MILLLDVLPKVRWQLCLLDRPVDLRRDASSAAGTAKSLAIRYFFKYFLQILRADFGAENVAIAVDTDTFCSTPTSAADPGSVPIPRHPAACRNGCPFHNRDCRRRPRRRATGIRNRSNGYGVGLKKSVRRLAAAGFAQCHQYLAVGAEFIDLPAATVFGGIIGHPGIAGIIDGEAMRHLKQAAAEMAEHLAVRRKGDDGIER